MTVREGSLEAPKRLPIDWQSEEFTDPDSVDKELERVFDVCHTCRRCVNLCNAFPILFDLIDESETFELDSVDKEDYKQVVDNCYLCDICAETKCPYLPPHTFAVDFPHLMLRAKARYVKEKPPQWHTRLLTSTEPLFSAASSAVTAPIANLIATSKPMRKIGEKVAKVHADAPIPKFTKKTASRQLLDEYEGEKSPVDLDREDLDAEGSKPVEAGLPRGKVAIYVTCYGDAFDAASVDALRRVLTHNGIHVRFLKDAHCCGMPKFELGDIASVVSRNQQNAPTFLDAIQAGYDLMSVVPSCTLMYRQEMPLLLPEDDSVHKVAERFFDPFEYLWLWHGIGKLRDDFTLSLGKVSYHAACHQRVQNIGRKTQDVLNLIPNTEVSIIERCSGHGGTHAIREGTYESAMKIARPVTRAVNTAAPDRFGSDCPIAGRLIVHGLDGDLKSEHPIQMLANAYGLI